MADSSQIHTVIVQQQEIYRAVQASNLLAVLGRFMELGMLFLLHRGWLLVRSQGRR